MSSTLPNSSANSNIMWPPGTVILEDPTAATREDIILQPRPTDDPNDPLNWPQWRKYLNMGLVCFYVAMVAELINASTPTWGPMQKDLGFSYEILNDSYAAGCAALGIGSVILIPFALKFGRRPLYLFSTIAQFAVSIWSAKMQTVADLMLVNIFQCLFGSLAEVIVQMTIADVFFVHQRGRMNAFYVWTWLLTSSMGVLVAGFVAQGQGWRWIWWWNVIILGITILLVGFGYEETKYCPTEPVLTSNMQPTTNNNHPVPSVISDDAKFATSDISEAKSMVKKQHQPGTLDTDSVLFQSANENLPANITTVTINPNIPKRTYWQRLAIVTTSTSSEPNESFFRHMYQPLILMTTIPAVAYTALVYGILVGLGDVMSTTMSTYLPQSPYNFNSSQIGLMSLPKMIGVTIGALILGPMSDWWIVYLSRRRGGVYDPETRLWCIVPFLPFVPVGALLFGIGLNNDVSWPVIAVGLALYNVGIAPINTIMITYLTDSYQDIIGDAVVGVTLSRNTFSTVFIFALSPWIAKMGLQNVFIVILVIVCALLMFVGVFIRYGKSFREFSAARYEYYAARQYRGRDAEQFSH